MDKRQRSTCLGMGKTKTCDQRVRGWRQFSTSFLQHGIFFALLLLVLCRPQCAIAKALNPTAEETLVGAQETYFRADNSPDGQLQSYIALRDIWATWSAVDPLKVEHALLLAADDTSHSAPVRQYARKLIAYARLRRGDVYGAQQRFSQAGYITEWLVVGPFDNEGKSGFLTVFEPESAPTSPIVPGRAFSGKERPVRYRKLPQVFRYGWVDLGQVFRPSRHMCGFATSYLEGKRPQDTKRARNITLFFGSNGAHRLHFNGQLAFEGAAYRGFETARKGVTVELLPGVNRISLKVCGADSSPMFALWVGDQQGNPDADLRSFANFIDGEKALANVKRARGRDLPHHPAQLAGPLSFVEEISSQARASADELEHATRYLLMTGSDDSSVHQARDLAKRAAEARPSVETSLLLAELAEDRNAADQALLQAEKLAHKSDVRVLLARAAHRRSGPNPRQAFPLYDQVLALDPHNLTALRGRVELYNRAGLKRTALQTLEDAYAELPHSVVLANMVASQRGALGLAHSADEAENHYASLRFDDSQFVTDRLDLSVARGSRKDALHWLGRLQQSDAHSLFAYQAAARALRALGDEKRALLELEKAREIAPEDVGVLQALADLKGRMNQRDEQLALLREVLRLRPQQVGVRKYVDYIVPPEIPADERYAKKPEEFLRKRHLPADGHPRRTLQDLTVTTVYENGLSNQFRQIVFQPMTDASAASSRQYAFQYQADSQRVQLRGARVFRANGNIDEAIESGEGAANDPSLSMYTSARTYYVQFPRLEPGDVVELRYRIEDVTARNEFADYFGDVVFLQSDEPIAHAEYVLIAPSSRRINFDAKVPGLTRSTKVDGAQKIYRFAAQDVPALVHEPNMPPWSEVLGFVHASTYSSWNELGSWYWGLVREQLDLDQQTRDRLAQITKDASTVEEKVKAVYAWVTKNTRYVALEFGIYGFKPRRCVQTVNRGWGDCKDKATVIVTFLRELGIDANLVILRTGMRGDFHSKLPSLAPFDHAIAYVPALDLYLDGTAEHTGIGELPVMDHNALGLLVLDGKAKLTRLPAPDPSKNVVERTVTSTVDREGNADVTLDYRVRGYSAPGYRARYEAASTRSERLATDLGNEYPGIEIEPSGIRTSDLSDGEQPVSLTIKGKVPRFARSTGSSLSMNVSVGQRLTARYAAMSAREQDVAISGFSTHKETTVIRLPRGAEAQSLPPAANQTSRFGSYSVAVEETGSTVTVRSHLSLAVTRVTPQDYPAFRKFCVAADQAFSHRLVISHD